MYLKVTRTDTLRIPPERLGKPFEEEVNTRARANFEGRVFGDYIVIFITDIRTVGEGKIIHGDGSVYLTVKYDALAYRPELHEVIEGTVCEIVKFGAFIRFGPLDGLLHVSQIIDDKIDVDMVNERLVGRETKRDLKIGDRVRARIVALSLNERSPRESKIGLTMRQPGLGKLEWLEEDRKKKEEKDKKVRR